MTIAEFSKLKLGTSIGWKEGPNSPRSGEIIDHGMVSFDQYRGIRVALWTDGQITDGNDDWALQQIVAIPEIAA